MEHIENTENTIEVFKSDIELYIKLWCEENNIDDICSISQNRYNALLYYLYLHVFKDNLKSKECKDNGLFNTSFNAYDMDLIESIVDIYIFMSDQYDKIISVQGFCRLTGISDSVLYEWSNDDRRMRKASSRSTDIVKKLTNERERTLSDRLASGVKNPVGVLGCLNHWHNWAGVGNMEERKPQQTSLEDVRKSALKLTDNSSGSISGSTDNGILKLSDNSDNSGVQ